MVNFGPSKGCQTCRQKKVKCDQAKPNCERCATYSLVCGGYQVDRQQKTTKFIDQTAVVKQRWQTHTLSAASRISNFATTSSPALIITFSDNEEDVALHYFIRKIAPVSHDFRSTRCFFEHVPSAVATSSRESTVMLCITAVALKLYNSSRMNPNNSLHQKRLSQAIKNLRNVLTHPVHSKTTETLLATVLLQFHEKISAICSLKQTEKTHQDGALALVRHRGLENFNSETSRHLMLYVRQVQVCTAIQYNRPVPQDLAQWPSVGEPDQCANPELDRIGVFVANLHYDFKLLVKDHLNCATTECTTFRSFKITHDQAWSIDSCLRLWLDKVPDHWRPFRFSTVRAIPPTVTCYLGICEIYPTIQTASTMNTYRLYRLIVLRILLVLSKLTNSSSSSVSAKNHLYSLHIPMDLKSQMQKLADEICYSMPYHLGNRSEVSGFTEVKDASLFPGYHGLSHHEIPENMKTSRILTPAEHVRHIIAQGAWHLMLVVDPLVNLLLETNNHELNFTLRAGQLEWIREQRERVSAFSCIA